MNETHYQDALWKATHAPESRQEILQGLFHQSPAVAARLAMPLWAWTCGSAPAPDMMLGDGNDVARAVIEFKSLGAAVQYTSVAMLRGMPRHGNDPMAERIRAEVDAIDRRFDVAHQYETECDNHGHTGHAFRAGLHQGDVYRGFLPGVPSGLQLPPSLADLEYIFVAPSRASASKFMDKWEWNARDEWSVLYLELALPEWEKSAAKHLSIRQLIVATRTFLHLDA